MYRLKTIRTATNNIVRCLPMLILLVFSSSSLLAKQFCDKCDGFFSHFYVGADAQWRRMAFKANYGHNLFRDDQWGGNIFLGARINCNVGLEIGFEKGRSKDRETSLTEGELVTGMPIPADLAPALFQNKTVVEAPHINLIGYLPTCQGSNLLLIGSVGLAWSRAEYTRITLAVAGVPQGRFCAYSRSNLIPRVMGGLQYQFAENLSLRGTLTWENTKSLHAESIPSSAFVSQVKPEDSLIVGLGIVFCCF